MADDTCVTTKTFTTETNQTDDKSHNLETTLQHFVMATTENFVRLEQRVDKLELRMGGIEQRMEKVEGRLDKLEQHMEKVEQRLEKIEQRLDILEQRVEKLEQRMEIIEQKIDKLTDLVIKALLQK